MQKLTPYEVIAKVNEILESAGLKELPTQMGYNYARKGMIRCIEHKVPTSGVTVESAAEWATKYLTKRLTNEGILEQV
jgi:hypothetical protein